LPLKSTLNAPTYSQDGDYILQLASAQGTFTFHGYEIPENLTYLGGEQLLAVHNFPGGIRTVQTLGYFPAKIQFSGWLFALFGNQVVTSATTSTLIPIEFGSGANVATALDRMQALKNICNSGAAITLSYGGVDLIGYVENSHFNVRNQFRVSYELSIVVTQDKSQIQNAPNNVSQRQVLQQKANKIAVVQANPSMPYAIGQPLGLFQDGLTALLLKYNNATAADFQNVLNLASSVSGAITPFITGSNSAVPELQSLALQTNSAVTGTVNSITAATVTTLATIQVANPNLFSISSAVLGDASLAPVIAAANGLTDMQPLGQFTLNLPPPPTVPPTAPGG